MKRGIALFLLVLAVEASPKYLLTPNLCKNFGEYILVENEVWKQLFDNFLTKFDKNRWFQYVCDRHKDYLLKHRVGVKKFRFGKVKQWSEAGDYLLVSRDVGVNFQTLRRLVLNNLTKSIDLSPHSDILENANQYFSAIKYASESIANKTGMDLRKKCSLTSELRTLDRVYYHLQYTLLRSYILLEFSYMVAAIEKEGINYMFPSQLRSKFIQLYNSTMSNFIEAKNRTDNTEIVLCDPKKWTPRKYQRIPAKLQEKVYFSLKEVTSDIDSNKIVLTFRFTKHKNIYHLQIMQGQLGRGGNVIKRSAKWKPIEKFSLNDKNITETDYMELKGTDFAFHLTSIKYDFPFAVTGVKLVYNKLELSLMVRFNEIRFPEGTLVPTEKEGPDWIGSTEMCNDPIINFKETTSISSGCVTLSSSLLDMRSIFPRPYTPLKGVGVFFKYVKRENFSGGFLTPKLIPMI